MPLKRSEKESVIQDMTERLKRAEAVIVTDYRGLTVSQIGQLRGELRKSGSELHVIKNSLAKRAFEGAGIEPPSKILTGPSALLLLFEDLSAPTKALRAFIKDLGIPEVKGGVLSGKMLDAKGIVSLADLPSRDELRATFLSVLQAPQRQFVTVLSAPLRNFLNVLIARAEGEA